MNDLARKEVQPVWKADAVKANNRPTKPKRPSEYRQRQMRAAKQGPCRVCAWPPPNNLHHVIPRSKGLIAWTESNLVPLCGSGTTGCHGKVEAHDRAACRLLAESLTNAEYSYVVEVAGEGFLERRYGIRYERVGVSRSVTQPAQQEAPEKAPGARDRKAESQ